MRHLRPCEAAHSCGEADFLHCALSDNAMGRDMYFASSIAERAINSLDRFINHAMTYAWTSTLQRRCTSKELMPPLWRRQPEGEEDYGGGDLRSPEAEASTDDDQPLE